MTSQGKRGFGQGFTTTSPVAATILDQAWYQLKASEVPDDAVAFEAATLRKHGMASLKVKAG